MKVEVHLLGTETGDSTPSCVIVTDKSRCVAGAGRTWGGGEEVHCERAWCFGCGQGLWGGGRVVGVSMWLCHVTTHGHDALCGVRSMRNQLPVQLRRGHAAFLRRVQGPPQQAQPCLPHAALHPVLRRPARCGSRSHALCARNVGSSHVLARCARGYNGCAESHCVMCPCCVARVGLHQV